MERFRRFKNGSRSKQCQLDREQQKIELRKIKREEAVYQRRSRGERMPEELVDEMTSTNEQCTWDNLPEPSYDALKHMTFFCSCVDVPSDACVRLMPWLVWIDSEIRTTSSEHRGQMIGMISAMCDSDESFLVDVEVQLMKILIEMIRMEMCDPLSKTMASYGIGSLLANTDTERVLALTRGGQSYWVVHALLDLWISSSHMVILQDVALSARKLIRAGAPIDAPMVELFTNINQRITEEIIPSLSEEGVVSDQAFHTVLIAVDALHHFVTHDDTFPRRFELSMAALLTIHYRSMFQGEHITVVRVALMGILALLDGNHFPMEGSHGEPISMHQKLAMEYGLAHDLVDIIEAVKSTIDTTTVGFAISVFTSLMTFTSETAVEAVKSGMVSAIYHATCDIDDKEMHRSIFILLSLMYRRTHGLELDLDLRKKCAETSVHQIESDGLVRAACRLLCQIANSDMKLFQTTMGQGSWTEKIMQMSMETDDDAVENLAKAISIQDESMENDWDILP